jgi:hypothetical protein
MSAASFTGAPPGSFGPLAPIEAEFLNRAGLVWRGLLSLWAERPDDSYPTYAQLAALCPRAGVAFCARTIKRGLADLVSLGKIAVEADPSHPVGRRIVPLVALPIGGPRGGDNSVTPDNSVLDSSVTPYVLRESASALYVSRQTGEGGDNSVTPPAEPLTRTLGRLEGDPLAVEACVARLAREYGEDFTPFYRKTCQRVLGGQLAVGELIFAVEEAERPGVRNRGKAFIAAVKRRLSGQPKAAPAPTPVPAPTVPLAEPEPEAVAVSPEAAPVAVSAIPEAIATIPGPNPEEVTRARWEALPEAERETIRVRVRAENPGLGRWKNMLEPLCLAAMGPEPTAAVAMPAREITTSRNPGIVASEDRVEVLPTDRELGALTSLARAEDPLMRALARDLLRSAGRDDVYLGVPWEREPAGKPQRSLPAGKQPS